MKQILGLLLLAAVVGAPARSAEGPSIFYSREHGGGSPAYVQVTVDRHGNGVYRETVDDPDEEPVRFVLRPYEVEEIFRLADRLDRFQRPLESNLKVANMGMKTFRWIDGDQSHEQKFNFSKDADARVLADWFARITESAQHFINLDRAVQFDKLGVNEALLNLQVTMEKNRLVAPDQFLPLLDRVAKNENYLNMARSRAEGLAQAIRGSAGGSR